MKRLDWVIIVWQENNAPEKLKVIKVGHMTVDFGDEWQIVTTLSPIIKVHFKKKKSSGQNQKILRTFGFEILLFSFYLRFKWNTQAAKKGLDHDFVQTHNKDFNKIKTFLTDFNI